MPSKPPSPYAPANSRRRLIVDLVAAAAGVDTTYAPPARVYQYSVSMALHLQPPGCLVGLIYLVACLAVPDTSRVALDGRLAAECAGVSRVLGDFDLLDLLAEGGTVTVVLY